MRFKAIWKDTFREISQSIMRFLAILIIIFLGVGFFVGISATSPNMVNSADQYFTEHNYMDYRVSSTYGLTDQDIADLETIDNVNVQSHYAQDFMVSDSQETIRLYSYDLENGQDINQYYLVDGRLPEQTGEIALDSNESFLGEVAIGDTISLNDNEEAGDPAQNLNTQTFEVVGFVNNPMYIDNSSRGNTTIGSGTLNGFGVIPEEDYNTDVKTEAYLTVDGSENYQSYSSEYENHVDQVSDELGSTIDAIESRRSDEIQAEAQAEIDQGWTDIETAEQELADAEAELETARQELDDGWAQYETGVAELEEQAATAREELAQNEAQLDQTIQELNAQEQELLTQRENLVAEREQLNASEEELTAGIEQLEEAIAEMDAGLAEFENNRPAIEAGLAELNATEEELNAQLEANPDLPEAAITEIEAQIEQINESRQELNATLAQEDELRQQRAQLQTQLDDLYAQEEQLTSGQVTLNQGIEEIDSGLAQIAEGQEQANAGYAEIEEARATLEAELSNAQAELDEAYQELIAGEEEYEEGQATFEEEQQTAQEDIEQGRADLEEAEAELADLPLPSYQSSRRTDNSAYAEYNDNAERLSVIARVFPVFFFLIAILISFTTMTRMVDEEREYVGIMKALGYSNRHILIKFITYAVLATALGSVLGLAVGYTFIPQIIFEAYSEQYNLPGMITQQYTSYTLIALFAAFASTVGASLIAVRNSLQSNAAQLLQPKAPKSGTHILLEKVPIIWERLSFNYKVTFRNVFRYKSRMLMTILGVAGSTGLILTGFGISDSISDIPDIQYGDINQFQAYVAVDAEAEQADLDNYVTNVQESERINDSLFVSQQSVTVGQDTSNPQDVELFVPSETESFDNFVQLKDYEEETFYTLDDSGAYVTQKLADLHEIEPGESITVSGPEDEKWTVDIAGIVENYIGHTLYMSPEYYQEISGTESIDASVQLIKYDTDEVAEEELGSALLDENAVLGISYVSDIYGSFSGTLDSLDLITQILIVSAAALAFIVLYNLTNINVSERERELSTIKVLGFHNFEVTKYIYRENIILTLLGILVGFGFGSLLHRFIMTTMEVDMLVFGKEIHGSSFAYSGLLTILFSLIVMVVIHYQLKQIDMVEALKGND